jgi:histone H3/H4
MPDEDGHDLYLPKGGIKNHGKETTGRRISDDAVLRVMMEEENSIAEVFQKAAEFAEHADRATIMERDIILAYKYERR